MRTDENRWVDLSNGVTWAIIFSLAAIIMSICALAHECPREYGEGKLGFDYLGVIVGILALLVTLLVAWNIFSTIRATSQIDRIERQFRHLEKTIGRTIDRKIKDYDYEVAAMINFTLGKCPVQLHQFTEMLNKHFERNIATNMLDQCLFNLGMGLQNLNHRPDSGNFNNLYGAINMVVSLIEDCERSLKLMNVKNIDKVITEIKNDKVAHEGVDKKSLISRLENIKSNVEKLNQGKDSDNKSGEETLKTTEP
ncbi:MAG: hypothetical protein HFJ91_00810 [Muribaculaceae bacterium]|nr:hypothetical protein [Muribaculaceae bacterium]